jgi:ankyrin repeat domain-containing protein 50
LEWLWTHEEYRAWSTSSDSGVLFIEGKPGSGKSTLTKYFKENVVSQDVSAASAIITEFFYSYREGELQTSHYNMLRTILYGILEQDETVFYHFQHKYREAIGDSRNHHEHSGWSYAALKDILLSLKTHSTKQSLYLIIDAVDESDNEDRRDIVELLCELCEMEGPCVIKVFVASRPVKELMGRFTECRRTIRLQDVNETDISNFASSFLPSIHFNTDTLIKAKEYIVEHAQGVFLWVSLVKKELIEYASEGYSEDEIFEFLKNLPTELKDFYEHILRGLEKGKERDIRDGIRIFRFVLYAFRPLSLEELRDALAIPDNPDDVFTAVDGDFLGRRIRNIENRVIHCGGNLLEIRYIDGAFRI